MPAARTRGMLAARIVRLTITVGAATIGVALVAAVISTSRLTAETARNRDLRVIQSVEDGIESHFRSVAASIEQATNKTQNRTVLEERLAAVFDDSEGVLREVLVLDRRGRVLSAYPQSAEPTSTRELPAFLNALAGRAGFLCVTPSTGGPVDIWATRTVFDAKAQPILVLARLDRGFVNRTLAAASRANPHRTLLVMQGSRVIGAAPAGSSVSLVGARWSVEGPQSGSLRARSSDGSVLEGHYNDIGGIEGIGWRAVILTPMSERVLDTTRTVAPPILVLIAGGLVALALAWIVALQLSRPLKDLERAALNAAAGSYARPLSTVRDDEVGRVADAFNGLALRINALQDVTMLLASASSLDQVLDGILRATGHLVGPGSGAVYLIQEEGDVLVPVRTQGFELSRAEPIHLGDGRWVDEVLRGREPLSYEGSLENLCTEVPGLGRGPFEVIGVPLVAGRDELGLVLVTRNPERPLTEAERQMLTTFTAQAAVAVQTSRLFEVESESRQRAEALRSVAEQLVRPTSLQSALNTVERIIARLFSAKDAIVALADRSALGLAAAGESDIETHLMEAAYRLIGRGRDEEPRIVERGQSEGSDRLLDELGTERLLLVPIALETDHGGVLAVLLTQPLSEAAVDFGRALGDELALALDNAYLYQRAVARAANLETIFRISQAVGSSLQVNVVLNRVLDVVQKILSADAVALMSFDRTRRVLATVMGRGVLPASILRLEVAQGEDVPGQVFARGEPISLRDLNASSDGVGRIAAEHELRSLLAVPLLARGRSMGVLMVFSAQPAAFTDEDLSTLQTFASQAALAIDTARLYSREHEVASVLQDSIVPEALPEFEELEAGSVYAPAGEEAEIGGDYYDLFRAKDGAIWFAIADVCGKGVYAATKTSMIKYMVRALASSGEGPAAIIGQINEAIAETDDPSEIVTMWLGRYEPECGRLRWADGGHPPGLLRRAGGEIERLEVTGPLLGARMGIRYDELEAMLQPGDQVLLYTDGVTEARRGNIFYGEDRVVSVLGQTLAPEATARRLLDEVREYALGELRDDVAVLAVAPRGKQDIRQEECRA